MHIRQEPFADRLPEDPLAHERIGHQRRLQPAARGRLVGAGPEHRLVARARVLGKAVLPHPLSFDRARRRAVHVEPHARHPPRRPRVIARPADEPRKRVVARVLLPAAERAILRVGIDPDVVTVLHAKFDRVRGVHVHVALVDERHPLVATVEVTEGTEQHRDHVGVDRHRVGAMAVLRCVKDKAETFGGTRMRGLPALLPRHHDVASAARLARQVASLHAVHLRPLRADRLVRRRYDDVRLIKGGVHWLAVHRQVLAGSDELILLAVELEPPALGVPGHRVGRLLVANNLRRCAAVQQRGYALQGLGFEVREVVALRIGGMVEDPLEVDVGPALPDELPAIAEPLVAGQRCQLFTSQCQHLDVADRVEDPLQRRPGEDIQKRVGHRRSHVRMFHLGPRVHAEDDVGPFTRRGPPPFVNRDHLDARQHVDDRVVVPLDIAEDRVRVGKPQRLGWRRHMRRPGQQLGPDAQRVILVVVEVRRLGSTAWAAPAERDRVRGRTGFR